MNLLNRKFILLLVVVGAFDFSFGQSSSKIKPPYYQPTHLPPNTGVIRERGKVNR